MHRTNVCILIGVIVLVVLAVTFFQNNNKQNYAATRESYMTAGAMNHLDSLDPRYELINAPDAAVPAEHFADLVDCGDQQGCVQAPDTVENPLERLERLQSKTMLPMTAAHLPQYNVDVANPATYSFAVNAPRVLLKNRLHMQADPFRGDVPIRYHPDVPLIGKSSNGRDSWRGDGFFSDHFAALYNKSTGRAYKNMPLKVAVQGINMDGSNY